MPNRFRHASLTLLLLAAMLAVAPAHLGAQEIASPVADDESSLPQLELWHGFLALLDSIWSSIVSIPVVPPEQGPEPSVEEVEYDVGIDPSG